MEPAVSEIDRSAGGDPRAGTAPEYALDITGLSKSFRRYTLTRAGYTTIKTSLLGLFRKSRRCTGRYTHAVRDLTLRIPRGSSVGIIGRNGSGKSTLLKLITGIYKPDTGTVKVNGRLAALIELGAGFHPDFTGRENLYLGGIMHGLSRREIDGRFKEIVEFADLADVIDDPVRTYSSGMFMRLGFSLAIHTEPDILLVDEVLAVGDAAFVARCKERLSGLRRENRTLLLVSHDLDAVERWCDEALWLDQGRVMDRGDPRRVIDHYRQFVEKGEELELLGADGSEAVPASEVEAHAAAGGRWGSREIEIVAVRMRGTDGEERQLFHPEDRARIEIDYVVHQKAGDVVFGIALNREDGVIAHGSNTDIERSGFSDLGSRGTVIYDISRLGLLDGSYSLDVAAHRGDGYPYDYHKGALLFRVRWPLKQAGIYLPEHKWDIRVGRDVF